MHGYLDTRRMRRRRHHAPHEQASRTDRREQASISFSAISASPPNAAYQFGQRHESSCRGAITWRAPGADRAIRYTPLRTRVDAAFGIDLDHCRDVETGQIEEWASDIVGHLDAYTEASPSGSGVHIICKGTLPPGGRRIGPVETLPHHGIDRGLPGPEGR
jgi:hypothetical protein